MQITLQCSKDRTQQTDDKGVWSANYKKKSKRSQHMQIVSAPAAKKVRESMYGLHVFIELFVYFIVAR